eukprot:1389881-Amphidinium_carterae.1
MPSDLLAEQSTIEVVVLLFEQAMVMYWFTVLGLLTKLLCRLCKGAAGHCELDATSEEIADGQKL